jgi:hypothetical protein
VARALVRGTIRPVFVLYEVIKARLWSLVWVALIVATVVLAVEGSSAWWILAVLIAVLGFAQLHVLTTVARRRR